MSQIINNLPELELIVLFSLLNIARFENQRWTRAISRGFQGRSEAIRLMVYFVRVQGISFYWVSLWFVGFGDGWISAILLFIFVTLIGWLTALVMTRDRPSVWIGATAIMIPLQLVIAMELDWYGALPLK
jgi:hypothetical protein